MKKKSKSSSIEQREKILEEQEALKKKGVFRQVQLGLIQKRNQIEEERNELLRKLIKSLSSKLEVSEEEEEESDDEDDEDDDDDEDEDEEEEEPEEEKLKKLI